jgi:toxin CcdB
MARFDVFNDPRGTENLLVVVQSDDFERLDTRLAIPLLPEHPRRRPLGKLNPVFDISGRKYALYTQHMLAVPREAFGTRIANIRDQRDQITAAIDFLMQGF